jgi:hypothetical protein
MSEQLTLSEQRANVRGFYAGRNGLPYVFALYRTGTREQAAYGAGFQEGRERAGSAK